jgi:hypothetical protein
MCFFFFVSGYTKAVCFINPDEKQLISQMFGYMEVLSNAVFQLASERWASTIKRLGYMATNWIPHEKVGELIVWFKEYI